MTGGLDKTCLNRNENTHSRKETEEEHVLLTCPIVKAT
jgi:hypothetical protein